MHSGACALQLQSPRAPEPTCHNWREAHMSRWRSRVPQLRPDAAKNNKNKINKLKIKSEKKKKSGTSLVVQWLRIRLPMQGTGVRSSLVWEDPTCCGATKPMCHNYWACALEPASHNYWSPHAQSLCSATREATAMRSLRTTTKSSPRSPQLAKARAQQRRPNAAKNKLINKLINYQKSGPIRQAFITFLWA